MYKRYAQTIQDELDKGYVIKVESRDDKHCAGREWYLPHHPVVNPNKPEKVRRVLNGASKFRGISLNSVLLTGPDLLQRLIHTLMRFRQHQFAVSADIEGMFLQVGVLPAEQSVLRFLWREDPSRNIEVYQYTRHIFGAKDSPTCFIYALLRTARDNNSDFPEAAQAVSQKFYMDDYLDSMESPIIVQKISRDLIELLNRGGFKLTKFISNVPGLLEELEDKSVEQAPKEIGASKEESSSHVLGLKWDHVNDTQVVSRGTICDASKAVIQRLVLSLVSKIFDPIGLVSPFTMKARLLLKDVWRLHGQSWDDVLPKEMIERFESWSAELPTLGLMKIPRSYFSGSFEHLELHVFGDSSQEVFSAVAFLRALVNSSDNGKKTELAFVIGKARVAPMKVLTVPKLEVQAALLASRLRLEICEALTIQIQRTFMWTDSTTVLQWLNSLEKQPIFVANRVSEILEGTTVDQWHHVATQNNPADAGTRGLSSEALQNSAWLRGPDFLRTSDFPFRPGTEVVSNIQLKRQAADPNFLDNCSALQSNSLNSDFSIHLRKYSSYPKLLRIVAYVLRILPRHATYRSVDRKIVEPEEITAAEKKLQLLTQEESFPIELMQLHSSKKISKRSPIAAYSPFVGPGGLLCSSGRIKRFTELEFNLKHPIILDGRHPLVYVFLRHMHLKNHHEGNDYLRALVQQQYAVLKLRSILRSIRFNCVLCRKRSTKPVQPIMADLPSERLAFQCPPFTNVGLDYFGPFHVTIRRSSEKRWGFLLTCLTTRAIHVEIAHSMDTNSCVMGIERFIARRGMPLVIFSDNGTNFVDTEKELLLCFLNLDKQKIASELAQKGVKWKFNPPAAPHHGGVWERLVRSFKRTLYAILGNRRLTDEILLTTFCLVEKSLNNRPLTSVSSDANNLDALTPNHFLLGNRSTCLPSLTPVDDFNHRKRYARAQAYANALWKRWLKEYLPPLNRRCKWKTPSDEILKTGDLVWIIDSDSPRDYYPLARILSLRYGNDGIARSAQFQTKSDSLIRPIVNLIQVFESSVLGPEDVADAIACKRK